MWNTTIWGNPFYNLIFFYNGTPFIEFSVFAYMKTTNIKEHWCYLLILQRQGIGASRSFISLCFNTFCKIVTIEFLFWAKLIIVK